MADGDYERPEKRQSELKRLERIIAQSRKDNNSTSNFHA